MKDLPELSSGLLGGPQVEVLRSTPLSVERASGKLGEFLKDAEAAKHVDGDHSALLLNLQAAIQGK